MSTNIENRFVILLILVSVLIQILILHFYPLSISNDSFGYINLANNLFDGYRSFERSIGYPFLVAVTGVSTDGTLIFLVYIQALMAISIPVLSFYAIRPLGFWYANVAALLALVNLFPFTMATQVLTETPYMFCISLLGFFACRYFFTKDLVFLLCAVGATFLLTFVRVSGSTQFICLLSGLVCFMIQNRLKGGTFDRKLFVHATVALALFGSFTIVYNATTSRTAQYSMPHFMFNWVYRSGTAIHYGAVDTNNGPKTKELFATIGEAIQKSPNQYKTLARVAREPVKTISETKSIFDAHDAQLLVDDLKYNTEHSLRSWWIEAVLIGHVGIEETANLLGGAIKEAFIAHPEIVAKRLKTVYSNSYALLRKGLITNPIGPTTSWDQVPEPGTIRGEIRAKSLAQWVTGMDQLTGPELKSRIGYGVFPQNWNSAVTLLLRDRNYVAMGHYLTIQSMQVQRLVWFAMISGLFFLFWSKNPALCATLIAVGTLPPIISVFISEIDTRHLWMAWPIQLLAATLILESVVNCFNRIFFKISKFSHAK